MNKDIDQPADNKPQVNFKIIAAIIAVIIFTFVIDLYTPLGIAGGILYTSVVLLGLWLPSARYVMRLALISTFLILLGFLLSAPQVVLWVSIANRIVSVAFVWVTAFFVFNRVKTIQELRLWANRLKNNEKHLANNINSLMGDVSELKQAVDKKNTQLNDASLIIEEKSARLQKILDSVTDAIITIDENGRIESFNKAAEDIFGYSTKEVYGENVHKLMPEPMRKKHDEYLHRYRTTGETRLIGSGPREITAQRKDGSTFPAEISVAEMELYSQVHFAGIIRDITDRKQTEKRLHRAQKMETVGHLSGGIAHDFNNLLTAIVGNLEMARELTNDNEALENNLRLAAKAADRGSDLTQRLLAFSRKTPLMPKDVNVNELIPDVTELMRRTLGEDIDIETVLAGGLWYAKVDPAQLESSLMNLAVNARDAMPDGGKLTIETANARLDDEYASEHDEVTPGQYVMVAVTDTGTGMAPDVIDRAFDPFFSTKDTGKGTGLGLSMVFGFVKQSEGHIKIYSEEGLGTTFKLYLPKSSDGKRGSQTSSGRQIKSAKSQKKGTETLLIVEDDPDVRAFVVSALRQLGYTVLEAADGEEALKQVTEYVGDPIGLLITDVVLPGGMHGKAVADAIQEQIPNIKVLFTSGYTENAIVHQGRVDEGLEFLMKPYTKTTLSNAVRRIIEQEE